MRAWNDQPTKGLKKRTVKGNAAINGLTAHNTAPYMRPTVESSLLLGILCVEEKKGEMFLPLTAGHGATSHPAARS
jgi:hypothetical protein